MAEIEETYCFVNHFIHTVDSQRRIAIPADWRRKDGVTAFYLLPARENIVQLIPQETFYEQVIRKAQKMSLADARLSRDLALYASRAQKCVCDKQGRIQIDPALLAHGKFGEKIVLAGAFWHIQLWTPEKWEQLNNSENNDYFDVMQRINELPETEVR
ncbi:MAG: hypothetical protein J6Q65_08085 [Lentisphaeria bacterium]|nr:hypothetical protein [Lentisphaeria bacterium]MBO5960068.1 hypothetical protein [Lentisphaeria bacterium]